MGQLEQQDYFRRKGLFDFVTPPTEKGFTAN